MVCLSYKTAAFNVTTSVITYKNEFSRKYGYPNCMVRVDRDVNAVWNVWWTTAAARYGLKVRPSREAQRTPDVILYPGVLVRGGQSLWVDREFDTGGV